MFRKDYVKCGEGYKMFQFFTQPKIRGGGVTPEKLDFKTKKGHNAVETVAKI